MDVALGWNARYDPECITITPIANDVAFQLSSAKKKSGDVTDEEISAQATREMEWGTSSAVSFMPFRGRSVSYVLNGVEWKRLWLAHRNTLLFVTLNGEPEALAVYEGDVASMLASLSAKSVNT
jgi:hypothetical protein